MAELRLEWIDVKDLAENPTNWRVHGKPQLDALKGLLTEVGWAGALLYNERTKRLVDGHARKKVVRKGKVPVLVGDWSEEDERKILLSLDPIASMVQADKSKLDELLASTQFQNEALGPLLEKLAGEEGWAAITGPPVEDQSQEHREPKTVTCPACEHQFEV